MHPSCKCPSVSSGIKNTWIGQGTAVMLGVVVVGEVQGWLRVNEEDLVSSGMTPKVCPQPIAPAIKPFPEASSAAAAAAAKSLQSCLTLCNPVDSSPPGSPVLGILHARTLEWVAISFSRSLLYWTVILDHSPLSCLPKASSLGFLETTLPLYSGLGLSI